MVYVFTQRLLGFFLPNFQRNKMKRYEQMSLFHYLVAIDCIIWSIFCSRPHPLPFFPYTTKSQDQFLERGLHESLSGNMEGRLKATPSSVENEGIL